MKRKLLTIFTILLSFYGCTENITEPAFNGPALPELADNIPYDVLGSGKIVFQRIGPISNNYEGFIFLI